MVQPRGVHDVHRLHNPSARNFHDDDRGGGCIANALREFLADREEKSVRIIDIDVGRFLSSALNCYHVREPMYYGVLPGSSDTEVLLLSAHVYLAMLKVMTLPSVCAWSSLLTIAAMLASPMSTYSGTARLKYARFSLHEAPSAWRSFNL